MKGILTRFSSYGHSGRVVVVALFALLLSASSLHAGGGSPILGKSGDIYEVTIGGYGELFPEGTEASADAEVLRLVARRGSGTVEHYLVPGSEADDSDKTPSLSFDASTGQLYVVWSSNNDSTLTRINLASFDGSEWSETIEVSGNIYSNKSAPRLAVTHDRFELAEGSSGESSTRTVLHVVWSEETTDGEKVMYAPVVLIDGELASTWRRVHRLNDYVSPELIDDPFDGEVPASLLKAPTVDAASESNAVVIGFADRASGAFVQLELSTPAVELAELADRLADHLDSTDLCERIEREGNSAITSVASAARAHIVIVGRRIRSRALGSLADDTKRMLTERAEALCADGGLQSVSSQARAHIVIVGARSQDGDLLEQIVTEDSHVLLAAAQPVGDEYVQHLARLKVKSERAAPEIGSGQPKIFVSPNGTGALVVWEGETSMTYVETVSGASTDDAWSETFSLQIGDDLSRSEAYSILRDRARSLE